MIEKHDLRWSYLVDGTLMAKYVRSNKVKTSFTSRELNELFQRDDTALEDERENTPEIRQSVQDNWSSGWRSVIIKSNPDVDFSIPALLRGEGHTEGFGAG